MRVFREMRLELDASPPPPVWPDGYVHALFTRRPWRGRGVGAALLGDAFGRFWERGERDGRVPPVRAGRDVTVLGWVLYEKELGGAA